MTDPLDARPASPRATAQARFPDGRAFEAPPGTSLDHYVRAAYSDGEPLVIAAIVNGKLRELCTPLQVDSDVTPVSLQEADGARIYRRSLVFLLVTAAHELFPEAEIFVEHAATSAASFFCDVHRRTAFDASELRRIEERMREIVATDAPIKKTLVDTAEARALFESRGEYDKASLLAQRHNGALPMYELRGRRDSFQGFMAPSAGYLRQFGLSPFPPGFMLHFPHQATPGDVDVVAPYPKLFAVFEEAGDWLERLSIRSVGALNEAIAAGRLNEISLVSEALHEARIAAIAAEIASPERTAGIVLIAGPSSSGKTTFSKRLAVQLLARGRRPFPVALDDYFVDRHKTPLGPDGQPDFESVRALDLSLFNEHLVDLIAGRTVELPRYDFVTGCRRRGESVTLDRDGIVIVEGIHGLNSDLVPKPPAEAVYRVYVSALTQLNLDRHNRVNTTDTRLIRRIVRDAATRGYRARDTIARWPAVTMAEKQNIFAFQERADAIFNSALAHEVAILRPFVEPLLLQVRPDTREFVEANRLLSFLQWFAPAPPDLVPDNSILREFIGGSILDRFRPWGAPSR